MFYCLIVASDAGAGIIGLKIIKGDLDGAVKEAKAIIHELEEDYLTPKLFRQLASAWILQKQIFRATLLCLHCMVKFNGHHHFQALLTHLDTFYTPHILAMQDYLNGKNRNTWTAKDVVEEALETDFELVLNLSKLFISSKS